MKIDDSDYNALINDEQFKSELVCNLNGMTIDDYIAKVTDEMNKIDLSSVPIDKWDLIVAFSLAALEIAGDFFIGDPSFKHSLANQLSRQGGKTGTIIGQKLGELHKHDGNSPLDYQGKGSGFGGGDHRAMTFGHDTPLTRAVKSWFNSDDKDDNEEKSLGEKAANWTLLAHDLICFSLAIYSISSGAFIDCTFTKDGKYKWIVESIGSKGTPYESCDVFVALFKYLEHMVADFCSSRSLPIPGFSLLTHFPDRDVEAFAMKLYRNGMNARTMALQSVPVLVTEMLMALYIWIRSKGDDQYSEDAWASKKTKLLLISHGITSVVNIGKVIITKAPWRLNLVVIIRTCQLGWQFVAEEAKLTNRHIEKLDAGILKARLESLSTMKAEERAIHETKKSERMLKTLSERATGTLEEINSLDLEFKTMLKK